MTPEEDNAEQRKHAQELALAREVQRQQGGSLSEARGAVNQRGKEDNSLMEEVERRIKAALAKLRIVGPAVSGDYQRGWSVQAGEEAEAVTPLPEGIKGDILVHDGTDWVVLHSPGDDGLYALTASVSGGVPEIAWTETTEACPG